MKLKSPIISILDRYIIGKFLGTFFYTIVLIISIAMVFDISENLDEFLSKDIPVKTIITDYYMNFVPYFANLFSALFTFIAVIYFTSKMAYNSEIIAILSSGVSFHRFVRPYMVGAAVIALFSYVLGDYIIPPANRTMNDFKNTYIKQKRNNVETNIHRQLSPGVFIYMRSYNPSNDWGHRFTIERFDEGKLASKLVADYIQWDRERKVWVLNNFYIRDIDGLTEKITTGTKRDTTLNMLPEDYITTNNMAETLPLPALNREIATQKTRGMNTTEFEIEKQRRRSGPFSAFILTIIGVSLASRKVKGGLGLHLGLGILICFSYIMFMQISTVFAVSGSVPPIVAVWIPNLLFGGLAAYLYRMAMR
ncbi:MAG: LptF/LptG family permease [Mangrovibacterium sp.]